MQDETDLQRRQAFINHLEDILSKHDSSTLTPIYPPKVTSECIAFENPQMYHLLTKRNSAEAELKKVQCELEWFEAQAAAYEEWDQERQRVNKVIQTEETLIEELLEPYFEYPRLSEKLTTDPTEAIELIALQGKAKKLHSRIDSEWKSGEEWRGKYQQLLVCIKHKSFDFLQSHMQKRMLCFQISEQAIFSDEMELLMEECLDLTQKTELGSEYVALMMEVIEQKLAKGPLPIDALKTLFLTTGQTVSEECLDLNLMHQRYA